MDTANCHIMHNHELLAWQVSMKPVFVIAACVNCTSSQVQAVKKFIDTKTTSLLGNLDAAAASLLGSSAWLSKPLMSPSAGRKIAGNLMDTQNNVAWLTNHLHRLLLSHAAILDASSSTPSVSSVLLPMGEHQPGQLHHMPGLQLASVTALPNPPVGGALQTLVRTAQGDVTLQSMRQWQGLVDHALGASALGPGAASDASVVGFSRALAAGYVPGLGFPRILRGVQHRVLHAACSQSLIWAVNARGHVLASLRAPVLPQPEKQLAAPSTPTIGPVRAAELGEDRAVKVAATSTHCVALGKDGGVYAAACNSLFREGMQSSLPIWQPRFHQLQAADLINTAPVVARDIAACTLSSPPDAPTAGGPLGVVCALPSAFSPHAGWGVYIAGYTPPSARSSQGLKPPDTGTSGRPGAPSPLVPARSRARTSAMSALQLPPSGARTPPHTSSAPHTSPLREMAEARIPDVESPDAVEGADSPLRADRVYGPWVMQLAAIVPGGDTAAGNASDQAHARDSATWFTRMWMCPSSGALVLCDNSHALWRVSPVHVRGTAQDSMKLSNNSPSRGLSEPPRSRTASNSTAGSDGSVAAARLVLPARRLACPTPPWGPPPLPMGELLPDAAKWPVYNSVAVLGGTVAASSACGCAFVWRAEGDWAPHTVANGPAMAAGGTLPVNQVSLLPTEPPIVLLHHQRFALHDALSSQLCMAPYAAQAATVRISTTGHSSPSSSGIDTPRQRLRAFRGGKPPEFGLDSPVSAPVGSPGSQPAAPRLRTWNDINMALQHVLNALKSSPVPRQGTKASNQVIALVRAARALLKEGTPPLSSGQRGGTWANVLSLYAHVPWLWRPLSRSTARSRAGTGSTDDGSLPVPPPAGFATPLARANTDSGAGTTQAPAVPIGSEVECPAQHIDEERFASLLRAAESQTCDPLSSICTRSISTQQRSTSLSAPASDLNLLSRAASDDLDQQLTAAVSPPSGQAPPPSPPTSRGANLQDIQKASAAYSTMLMIERDVCRTMSGSGIFDDTSCPLHEDLRAVLLAFAAWDPVTAYPQGLSYLASVCCLVQDGRAASLRMLAVLTRQPCVLALLRADVQVLHWHCSVFEHALARAMPDLSAHLQAENFEVQFALLPWFSTLFLRCLPPPLALPGIDMFVLGGTRALYSVALALFRLLRPALMHASFDLLTRILTVNAMQIAHVVGGTRPPRTRWDADPEPSEPNALADPALLTTATALVEASDLESHVLVPHAMSEVEAAWAAVKPSTLSKAAHAQQIPSYIKHAIQVVDAGSDPSSVLTALSGAAGSPSGIDSGTLAAESSVTTMWSLMYGSKSSTSSTPAK